MPEFSYFLVSAALLLAGGIAGWLIASARKASAVHRTEAERDHAQAERARTDAVLADARRRLEEEQRLRSAADTRCEELQRRAEETVRFVEESRKQLEGTYAQLSQAALKASVQQLLDVVKPHLDVNKGEIVSTLDTKKVEIEGMLAPLRAMLETYQTQVQKSEKDRVEAFG
ncbi:MAG: hypothetical protein LC732_06150, partial [Acidobacteria bacterium]|nr:hypothetical protein [Acidobacteriota bacterium]